MRSMKVLVFAAAVALTASPAFAEVQVAMKGGRVSIVARDATLRQILVEWARVGQTKIVNVERVPGGPMSLELTDIPEEQALDILLRTLSGYLAAPRSAAVDNLSVYDRIVLMPTIASARPAASSAPPPPVFQQAPPAQQAADHEPDEQAATGAPGQNPQNPRGPVFNAFPPPQVVNPQQGQPPSQPYVTGAPPAPAAPPQNPAYPSAPAGMSVPGMIVQPPPQPGQPGSTQTPGQPVRRPGGE